VLLSMAWMSAQLGQLDSACRCFLRALDEDRLEPAAFYGLALCLALRGEYESADQCVKQAISLMPENPDFHIAGAWLSMRQRKWDLAVQRSDLALEICPNSPPVKKACRQIRQIVWIEKAMEKAVRFPPLSTFLKIRSSLKALFR